MSQTTLNVKVMRGAIWMVALRMCVKGIGLVSTLILVRLLSPDDFGVMALASSVFALVELLRAFGFETALIQNQNAGRAHYDTAWTLQVVFSLLAAGVVLLLAGPASWYYHDNRLDGLLRVMALVFLIGGFINIGIVEFRKGLWFSREFVLQISTKILAFLVTIGLAYYWRSYWALMTGMLTSQLTSLALSYALHPYRPRVSVTAWRELFGFSGWLLFNNFLTFLGQHAQNFLLGFLTDSRRVGIFAIGYEIATMTSTELIAPINRATYPGYAKVGGDRAGLARMYLDTISAIALLAFPTSIGIAATAQWIVPVAFGENWVEAIPVIQMVSIGGLFVAHNTNGTYIYLVLGRQNITSKLIAFNLLVYLPLLVYLTEVYGLEGAALAYLLSSALVFPIWLAQILNMLKISIRRFLVAIHRPLLGGIGMALCLAPLSEQVMLVLDTSSSNENVRLAVSVGSGVVVYTSILLSLWLVAGRPSLSVETRLLRWLTRRLAAAH
jgi:O-antigen/teichoic acid export membrane protein